MCPGKAKHQGYEFFIERAIGGVDMFGRGTVQMGLVSGFETMYGYKDIDEAVSDTLESIEVLLQHGVVPGGTDLTTEPGSALYREGQQEPPLEFYCKINLGKHALATKYGLVPKFFCYKGQLYTPYADMARYM